MNRLNAKDERDCLQKSLSGRWDLLVSNGLRNFLERMFGFAQMLRVCWLERNLKLPTLFSPLILFAILVLCGTSWVLNGQLKQSSSLINQLDEQLDEQLNTFRIDFSDPKQANEQSLDFFLVIRTSLLHFKKNFDPNVYRSDACLVTHRGVSCSAA